MRQSTLLFTSLVMSTGISLTACDTTGTTVVASPAVSAAPTTPVASTSTSVTSTTPVTSTTANVAPATSVSSATTSAPVTPVTPVTSTPPSVAPPPPAALPAATYPISGVVSGTARAHLALGGAATAATATDPNGNYSFASLADGSYTIVPTQTGFVFSPVSRSAIVHASAVTDVVFSGTSSAAPTFTLAGTVTGSAIGAVVITLNGTNVGSAITDGGGNYTFTGLVAGTYTVSASLAGYTFSKPLIVALSKLDSASNDFTSSTVPTGVTLAFTAVATLPAATVGKAYSSTTIKSITGGRAPYTYQADMLDTGTPPLGMYVNPNGKVTGTATIPGRYEFNVCAIDAAGALSACSPTSLTVVAATTPVPTPIPPPVPTPVAAPTVTLAASPATLTVGAHSSLTWSSTDAESCTASGGWTGNKAVNGTLSVSPTSTTTYTLACAGAGGTGQTSIKITVNAADVTPAPPSPSVSLTTSDATLTSGASATLTWSIKNATACTRSGGWTGAQTTRGSTSVSPTRTTTYAISCTGAGGSAQASVKETVSIGVSEPEPTVTLSADDTSITAGDSATLTWVSTNASVCSATGAWTGTKAINGSLKVSPASTATYTLACTSSAGTASASTRITVTAAPVTPPVVIPPVVTPPPVASGTSWVYYNGTFDWPGDYSFVATPNYSDTSGSPLSGSKDIKVTLQGAYGGWLPYAQNWSFNSRPYTKLTFALKPTVSNQSWVVYFVKVGDVPVGITLDVSRYGPAPVAGRWATYTIPLADLGVLGTTIYKFCIQDQTGLSNNSWYADNVGFAP